MFLYGKTSERLSPKGMKKCPLLTGFFCKEVSWKKIECVSKVSIELILNVRIMLTKLLCFNPFMTEADIL